MYGKKKRGNTETETFQNWFQLLETCPAGTKQQSKTMCSMVAYAMLRESQQRVAGWSQGSVHPLFWLSQLEQTILVTVQCTGLKTNWPPTVTLGSLPFCSIPLNPRTRENWLDDRYLQALPGPPEHLDTQANRACQGKQLPSCKCSETQH